MKIEGPGSVRNTTVTRTGRSDGTSGGSFAKQLAEDAPPSAGNVGGAGPLASVDALLAMQEVEDPAVRRKRGRKRGMALLDKLDDIRMALLGGMLTPDKLEGLSALVRSGREEIDDPRLQEILDEIDLRAQVELAKFSVSR